MAEPNNQNANPGAQGTGKVGFNNASDGFDQMLEKVSVKSGNESNAAVATGGEIDTVIETIIKQKKLQPTQEIYNKVLASAAHLVQIGATSPKFAGTRMVTDYGVELRTSDLREACSKSSITVRKFARGIRDYVIKVAVAFNIQGNLAKNYKLENPNCDPQDLAWVADFQTFSDNPAMPENVKVWLLQNYRNRFRPELKG